MRHTWKSKGKRGDPVRMGSKITPFDGLIAEGRVRVRTQGSRKKGSKKGGGKIGEGIFNKWGICT